MKKIFLSIVLLISFNLVDANNSSSNSEIIATSENISTRILESYVRKCIKKAGQFDHINSRFDKTGACGFVSLPNLHMDSERENQTVIVETTIWGERDELETPNKVMLPAMRQLLSNMLLHEIQQRRKAIYTTNTIESINYGIRKITKNVPYFLMTKLPLNWYT